MPPWRASTAALGNPGSSDAVALVGSPTADADADGFAAFVEHAFGTSDTDPLSRPAPVEFAQHPADGVWHVRFTAAAAADDVLITPEISTDLATWTSMTLPNPPLPAFRPDGAPGPITTWTSGPELLPPGQRFLLRLRVSVR